MSDSDGMNLNNVNDWNTQVIKEFRENGGKVGGMFANMELVLLHTTGAKSAQPRINPLAFTRDDDRIVIIASKGGAPSNPDWYYNILAKPDVSLEFGNETFPAHATVYTEGAERDRLYAQMAAQYPNFAEYEQKTTRKIPVVVLTRTDEA
jgi:deazaflavin-dependent oxidoreductase (nitroreductase family)